jgi:hypothetical protein
MHRRYGIPAGEVRRDCEPHRGPFLLSLGARSMALWAAGLRLLYLGWSDR